ncbi:ATP-grasp domain-containing protein [Actinocrispum wychmicini]|uniref:ATP-grasp domain-containing protein n=1 Tax=Actinocrispum wychmicini TaxID=1213861 RepID=A0A4R2JCD1_9PSEU|nr:ATP-grasp domain-containing protein [Actinocrispum wychmicini]TCO55662.1 ATP-grasp domain-containing protein [Actinocrispum wychmicini]
MTATSRTLICVDGPGGPTPEWFVPRLCDGHDLTILWAPAGDPLIDDHKRDLFARWKCRQFTFNTGDDLTELIKKYAHSEQSDGILCFSELRVIEAYTAALELGLPANPVQAINAMRDKYEQRKLLAAAGVPVPRYARVRTGTELKEACRRVGLPAILKPVTGAGSLATYLIDDSTDLPAVWELARAAHDRDSRGGKTSTFILEDRLIGVNKHSDDRYGDYASVESITFDGRTEHLAVTDKLPLTPTFRENGGILPSVLPEADIETLHAAAADAIQALGLKNCATHIEFKFTADGPRIIEVNCRIGGGVSEQLFYAADYDVVDALADISVGRQPARMKDPERYAAILLPQIASEPLEVVHAPTPDEVLSFPGAKSAYIKYSAGDCPRWEDGTVAGTLARVFAAASDHETLLRTFHRLEGSFNFVEIPC